MADKAKQRPIIRHDRGTKSGSVKESGDRSVRKAIGGGRIVNRPSNLGGDNGGGGSGQPPKKGE